MQMTAYGRSLLQWEWFLLSGRPHLRPDHLTRTVSWLQRLRQGRGLILFDRLESGWWISQFYDIIQ